MPSSKRITRKKFTLGRKTQSLRKTQKNRRKTTKLNKGIDELYNIKVNSVYLAHRILLIASLENNNLMNKDIIFNPVYESGTYTEVPTDKSIEQSFAFEYSTGTSNLGENFPNTFLPIMHIETVGRYLQKSGGLEKIILDKINEEILEHIINECRENAKKHLYYFIKRFGCWKELQISAALGGETWDTFQHFINLRIFALSHDYINDINLFIPRKNIIKHINLNNQTVSIEGFTHSNTLNKIILEYIHNNDDDVYVNNLSINQWLYRNHVLQNEKLIELSVPIDEYVKEKSLYEYQTSLFVVSNIEDVNKKIEFPSELNDAYEHRKNFINKKKSDITYTQIKKLFNDTVFANTKNDEYYQFYKNELKTLEVSPELYKYIIFLKYRKDRKEYVITGSHQSDIDIKKALLKAQREYSEYEQNKFNWKICK